MCLGSRVSCFPDTFPNLIASSLCAAAEQAHVSLTVLLVIISCRQVSSSLRPSSLIFRSEPHTPLFGSLLVLIRVGLGTMQPLSPCTMHPQLKQNKGNFSYRKLTHDVFPSKSNALPRSSGFITSIVTLILRHWPHPGPFPTKLMSSSSLKDSQILVPIPFVIHSRGMSCTCIKNGDRVKSIFEEGTLLSKSLSIKICLSKDHGHPSITFRLSSSSSNSNIQILV